MLEMNHLIAFYFTATITLNFVSASVVLLSGAFKNKAHLKLLLLSGVVITVFQYATWEFHDAQTLQEALNWLYIQSAAIFAALPISVLMLMYWSRQKAPAWSIALVSVASICFFLVNTFSDSPIWFTGELQLRQFTIFTGETVSVIKGDVNPVSYFYNIFILAYMLGLIYIARVAYIQGRRLLSITVTSTICLQILTTIAAALTDMGILNLINLGGLPFSLLNFFACVSISMSLEWKSASLAKEIVEKASLESMLFSLAKGVAANDSSQFFKDVCHELYHLEKPKLLYICEFDDPENIEEISTQVVLQDGRIAQNFSYKLSDIPNELISYDATLFIEEKANERFPNLALVNRINAQAIINAPLKNDHDGLEGSIILLYDRPIKLSDAQKRTLEVFTSRTASEIQRVKLAKEQHKSVYFDYLTKLPNLLSTHDLIKQQYDENQANDSHSALIIIDLKKFGQINSVFGFTAAEYALKEIGIRLSSYASSNIVIGRISGNQFSLLIKQTPHEMSAVINLHFDAIKRVIEKPIKLDDTQIELSCVGGAVVFPMQAQKHTEVIRCAEIALVKAKTSADDDICLFDATYIDEINRKQTVERLLRQALNQKEELYPVYQPKVDTNGKLLGMEALARWQSASLGFVSPFEFITIAESTGYIEELGLWMTDSVCEQINKWHQAGFEFDGRVAINVSCLHLEKATFIDDIMAILNTHSISPAKIEIEITESGLLSNRKQSVSTLKELQSLGFSIALDDFGTGYSSLSYLKDLPLDVLKIDRSFVIEIESTKAYDLVKSIVTIGKNMSLKLVAEGVEERKHIELLDAIGCDIYQGYYFAKPMKAGDLMVWATKT
ncbi:bifunctional diguanylate cyclase/phosphodiesterase [Glaciecola sp. MH2013]|uniref:putative bifunctional diguanylate cyclase/phosphodiesterase n=1 Tax=Glaciecola sp. MH2013 TaxID=2785524 RepID=UPI00189E9058|nr:bifunctional diguanylate cyclase/phosphodiesterase [Glaciecola sp. MH2013]MBF7074194.1 bifunctional diguanylate cyclase/phosphodiesterase [Glaciecola sp. MH2013]